MNVEYSTDLMGSHGISWEIRSNLGHAPGSPDAMVERDILNKPHGKFEHYFGD